MHDDTWMNLILAIVLILLFIYIGTGFVAERQCLAHGWAGSKVTFALEQYCIREENEYEITKPLRDIVEGK